MGTRKNPQHPVQPWDIRTDRVLVGALGMFEMEYTARLIILFCKLAEDWVGFTRHQLERQFSEEALSRNFNLAPLVANDLLVYNDSSRKYHVTDRFITLCHIASAKLQKR